ncbi:hypothetical protein HYALB_00007782 [Hymenoscyphus albidus]|uniref:Uncharacterized protein n=1 Tax=Hymenoscyphus albidus TaxID=595503 RepID=A0A9N9LLM7_9HELO|nr:hypothetical protein HYALB_00007782 [Hymenoscyphus albidus]
MIAFMHLEGAEKEILDYDNPSCITTALLLACSSCHGSFLYYSFLVIALSTRHLFIRYYQKSANTYRNSLSQEQLQCTRPRKCQQNVEISWKNELNPYKDNPANVSEKLSATIKQLQLYRGYIAYLEREIVSEAKKNSFKAEDVKLDV